MPSLPDNYPISRQQTFADDTHATAVNQRAGSPTEKASGRGNDRDQKKPSKSRSRAQRARDRQKRRAREFPDGPEAKALAEARPRMPAGLKRRIEVEGRRALWEQMFNWALKEMRTRARKGAAWHGKLIAKGCEAYPLNLSAEDLVFLAAWANHLRDNRAELRNGPFGPGGDVLAGFGVRSESEAIFDIIDELDGAPREISNPAPTEREAAAPAPRTATARAGADPADAAASNLNETAILPPVTGDGREMPFRFTELKSSLARSFWRAYWKSEDIEDLRDKAREFAANPADIEAFRGLSQSAEDLLIETMQILGIPLP